MRKILYPEQLDRSPLALIKAGVKTSVFKSKPRTPQLPEHQLHCRRMPVCPALVEQYHRLVLWKHTDKLHPAFVHVLAMPLHLHLLSEQQFPFKMTGLVHVSNALHQFDPIRCGDELDLICYLADLKPHHRGWTFSIVTQAWRCHQLVWQEISTNLALCQHGIKVPRQSTPRGEANWCDRETFAFSSQDGRRYARVSGDYNPIHLWPWSAKMLGFRRHIAHGMYTYALSLSVLYPQDEQADTSWYADVNFVKPLFLPSTDVVLQTESEHGGYRLVDCEADRVYLQGKTGQGNLNDTEENTLFIQGKP